MLFVDKGNSVAVRSKSDNDIEKAVLYAAAKFENVIEVTGDRSFQEKVVGFSLKYNIKIEGDNYAAKLYKLEFIKQQILDQRKKGNLQKQKIIRQKIRAPIGKSNTNSKDVINKTYAARQVLPQKDRVEKKYEETSSAVNTDKEKVNKPSTLELRSRYIDKDSELYFIGEALSDKIIQSDYYQYLIEILQNTLIDLDKFMVFNYLDINTHETFIKLLEYKNTNNTSVLSDIRGKTLADDYFFQYKVSNMIESVTKEDKTNKFKKMISLRNLCFEHKEDDFKTAVKIIKARISENNNSFGESDKKTLTDIIKIMLKYNNITPDIFVVDKLRADMTLISNKIDDIGGISIELAEVGNIQLEEKDL